ncbi:Elongator subunit elp2 [Saxophila tyrrhenica]|uniref:Elongator complex protein 2 n=1 Tax=Saxophila tyrrhenica TaxID=1690608 RepID=A0AAV9P7X3_9PEZI|nr:Elongator subunit elp2 [Saxophila tyrrhenica]
MSTADLTFCAAGGNRHPSAADWAPELLAFGAGQNVALWNSKDPTPSGISALLTGHTGTVNAVKIFNGPKGRRIITGAADNTIRIWKQTDGTSTFVQEQCLEEHKGSVNVVSVLPDRDLFVSGAADGTVRIWDALGDEARLVQTMTLKPRYLPLACALFELGDGAIVLAVAGTSSSIQLYFRDVDAAEFKLQATLTGHEGWIRSLDFVQEYTGDLLLASASQDKFIRLWRIQAKSNNTSTVGLDLTEAATSHITSLSNKAHQIGSADRKHNVTFEALLVGHEDWIYTGRWAPKTSDKDPLTLLSASADNSLSIWRLDESSNIWVCHTRLGEISAQKGSTTATGSTGGFWIGLWQPDGSGVASLGRTGSWRRWAYSQAEDSWLQQVGISGHTQEVQGCAWAPDGSYLLSTSSDQTTRMLAQWRRDGMNTWHEVARPQIHGYDLNCVTSTSPHQFVSGADEKLLRVFNKPKAIDELLSKLSGTTTSVNGHLPEAANIPVLGLSNKAVAAEGDEDVDGDALSNGEDEQEAGPAAGHRGKSLLDLDHPPFEEHLARHTLWPEHEKLYGHGYEISAVASSHDGSLIATACKASSIDHAVIRLYDCLEWREVKPSLTAHSLTVTSLSFSPDDKYLLSVSRDRGWYVYERDATDSKTFTKFCSNLKGHSRMILDCSWAPQDVDYVFATAGRDKTVKLWKLVDGKADLVQSIAVDVAVTAVAYHESTVQSVAYIAHGTEDGSISILQVDKQELQLLSTTVIDTSISPSAAVNALRWRPGTTNINGAKQDGPLQLAAASDDTSVRIYDITAG